MFPISKSCLYSFLCRKRNKIECVFYNLTFYVNISYGGLFAQMVFYQTPYFRNSRKPPGLLWTLQNPSLFVWNKKWRNYTIVIFIFSIDFEWDYRHFKKSEDTFFFLFKIVRPDSSQNFMFYENNRFDSFLCINK